MHLKCLANGGHVVSASMCTGVIVNPSCAGPGDYSRGIGLKYVCCWFGSFFSTSKERSHMGLLRDTYNCGLHMRWESRERFSRHRHQRKPLVSDPGMYRDTCVTHVLWCMSGSLTRDGGENVPRIPGACATRNITYLVRGPWMNVLSQYREAILHTNTFPRFQQQIHSKKC